jgi:predicted metal-dependent hydrolase
VVDLEKLSEGIALINRAQFFEAHEVLEDAWREAPDPEKKFLQGLIQVAVAFHHHSRDNRVGAESLLRRALTNLSAYPDTFAGVDLQRLRQDLVAWQIALEQSGSPSVAMITVRPAASDGAPC